MQLELLTPQERVTIARHLADAAVSCVGHGCEEVLSCDDSQESLKSLVVCALAFPGVTQQIGQYTCFELQTLVGTTCLHQRPQGMCHEGEDNQEDVAAILSDPEPMHVCAHNVAAHQEWSKGRPPAPQSVLAFL